MAQVKRYCTNTELYQDPTLAEGVDYGRRHRRHELFDDSLDQLGALARTTIIAPTGAGSRPAPRSCAWPWPATTRPPWR